MPLPSGLTDKIGNRYEGRWTVYCNRDLRSQCLDLIDRMLEMEAYGINQAIQEIER